MKLIKNNQKVTFKKYVDDINLSPEICFMNEKLSKEFLKINLRN